MVSGAAVAATGTVRARTDYPARVPTVGFRWAPRDDSRYGWSTVLCRHILMLSATHLFPSRNQNG